MQGAHQHDSDNLLLVDSLGFICMGSPAVMLIAALLQAQEDIRVACCLIADDSLQEADAKTAVSQLEPSVRARIRHNIRVWLLSKVGCPLGGWVRAAHSLSHQGSPHW